MYEKVRVVMFDEVEVTIYKSMSGEYFAEWGQFTKKKIPCGRDYQFIWEAISAEMGGGDSVIGWDLLRLADEIEAKLGDTTTHDEIVAAVHNHLYEHAQLWPAYVYEEVVGVLEYRYMHTSDAARVKIGSVAPIEGWFQSAISSKRIYRLETSEIEDQAVRIIGAHAFSNDYLVEFEVLEFGCDEDDKTFWSVRETMAILLTECTLVHKPTDELPPEYDEVNE